MSESLIEPFDEAILDAETVAALYGSYANACIHLNGLLEDDADNAGNFLCEGVEFFEFGLREELLAETRRMKEFLARHPHTVGRCGNCSEPQDWQLVANQNGNGKSG